MAEKYFEYLPAENRYVIKERDGGQLTPNLPKLQRTFEQAGVLHTSEDVTIRLTRAYNLENDLAINDGQIERGAEERGQIVGDISGGHFLKDELPEIQ